MSLPIDLFSRRVVGWSMQTAMTAQLVTDALVMAIWGRGKPDALLHHSDRGSQYTSELFQRLMIDHGVVYSMSRSGNVWDNAAMESFFSSLKTERTARKIYRTRDEAKADVFDYIEQLLQPEPPALDDRIFEPYGVRAAGWISLSGCQPNRVQLRVRCHRRGSTCRRARSHRSSVSSVLGQALTPPRIATESPPRRE
jgi:hypothetical protein